MKNLIFIFFVLSGFLLSAQTGVVKGRVLDNNNFPLPGATVSVSPAGKSSVTNFNGFFVLSAVAEGDQEISVRYIGFESATQNVQLVGGQTAVLDFILSPAVNELDEVIVSGYQEGIVKALNKQRNDLNVTNIVSADQAGKYPDDNIGDAIKRISGISVQNDQGEARDIIMRGFGPSLNSVTLNGDRIPSAEGDNRKVQLDLIPTNMIQSIEVNKSLTPDMEADAIGGSVNLVTRSNPAGFRASATLSGGTNPIRDEGYNANVALLVADKVNDKLSYTISTTIQSRDYGSDNVEFEWNDPADWSSDGEIKEMDIRRYDVKRTRRSVSLNLDYQLNDNNSLFFKSIYNHRDDWENRFRLRMDDVENGELRLRKQTKGGIGNDENKNRRLEDQRTQKYSLGGEHLIGKISMDWKASTSKAAEKRPDERYVRFDRKGVSFSSLDISNPERPLFVLQSDWDDPAEFKYKKTEDAQKLTEEENNSFKFNIKVPFNDSGEFKFGGKFKEKSKMRDDLWHEYDDDLGVLSDVETFVATINGYEPGDQYQHGTFATAEYLGGLTLEGANDPQFDSYVMDEFAGGNYDADETIKAGYLMYTNRIGVNTKVVAGVRMEATEVDYLGYEYDETEDKTPSDVGAVSGSKNYSNLLPSINIQHNFKDNLVLNLAFSQSIARPDYFDLVPYKYAVSEDKEVAFGNPDLEASISQNYDLMLENYFGSTGLLSGGLFYKSIDNWLYTFTTNDFIYNGESGYNFSQLRNGKSASVFGAEIAFQTKLFKNLAFAANYTFTDSTTDNVEGRNDVPLAGAVENMYNLSLAYETNKFFVRASMNHAGASLDELGGESWEDRYYDEQTFVDLNATFNLNDKIRFFVEAKNLTNQPLRYYQGLRERTMQLEYYNISWNAGVKIDL